MISKSSKKTTFSNQYLKVLRKVKKELRLQKFISKYLSYNRKISTASILEKMYRRNSTKSPKICAKRYKEVFLDKKSRTEKLSKKKKTKTSLIVNGLSWKMGLV